MAESPVPDDSPLFDDGLIHIDVASPSARDGVGADRALSRLTGVRAGDMDDDFDLRAKRGKPRLKLTATHALAAVLLMTFVTCVSLTLLVRQSMNYAALERDRAAQSALAEPKAPSGETAEDDGSVAGQSESGDATAEPGTDSDAGRSSGQSTDPTAPEPQSGTTDGAADTRVDLNSATLEQLDAIPGIGPVTAKRILDHRARIGRFTSVDQLLDVSGIGEKTLEKIRPEVRVR